MDRYCWEIIQCDNSSSCPARSSEKKPCWEVMAEHNSFQCHYGLCEECIVYLGKTGNPVFSSRELEEVMRNRTVTQQICWKKQYVTGQITNDTRCSLTIVKNLLSPYFNPGESVRTWPIQNLPTYFAFPQGHLSKKVTTFPLRLAFFLRSKMFSRQFFISVSCLFFPHKKNLQAILVSLHWLKLLWLSIQLYCYQIQELFLK